MTKLLRKITAKVLLATVCLGAFPMAVSAEGVQNAQPQIEQELNAISISVSESNVRVKNADGLTMDVYSITGEKVYTTRIEGNSKTIDLGQMQRGYYIVKIGKFTRKIYLH